MDSEFVLCSKIKKLRERNSGMSHTVYGKVTDPVEGWF